MIDALIKRVSVTYKCYEMYAHQGKKVQLFVFWDRSRNGRHFINYRHCLRICLIVIWPRSDVNKHGFRSKHMQSNQIKIKKFYLKSVHFITIQHKLSRAFQTDMHNKLHICILLCWLFQYSFRSAFLIVAIIDKVSCIRRKRGQIKGLQDNNKSMVIFFLKRRNVVVR